MYTRASALFETSQHMVTKIWICVARVDRFCMWNVGINKFTAFYLASDYGFADEGKFTFNFWLSQICGHQTSAQYHISLWSCKLCTMLIMFRYCMRTAWPDHINLAVHWSNFTVYIFNEATLASLLNDARDRVGLFSCKCCICMPKSRR